MRPRDIPCPVCNAAPGEVCDAPYIHRERADEASRQTPRPPPPDRGQVERLYREREQAWAALDAAARGEG